MSHDVSSTRVILRETTDGDIDVFFEQQLDPHANFMAAFTSKDPNDRASFDAHWARIRADESIFLRTILLDRRIAGYVLSHGWFGDPEISYWLGREFWGKGIATLALSAFLQVQAVRPLHARAAKDNLASLRVLQKCGFAITGEDRGFASARGEEVEEYILILKK